MTTFYIILVAMLLILAIFDLFVGVSNDAVNFLSSAIGVNVLKVIIGFGTFSLALAFAGNDLVNFVGVPLTSLSSVRHLIADGGNTGDYERFYCVDKSRSKETGGTGLGLAIVKHIAEVHKATIDLKSIVGSGTEIKVEF